MDKTNNVYDIWTFVGVILTLGFIMGGMWLVHGLFKNTIKEDISKLAFYLFSLLFFVWVADKALVVRRSLLTKEDSANILSMLDKLIWVIVGYYFGEKVGQAKKD